MTETIGLGTGRASSIGVGPKASLLDRALADGLAVPRGFVVPDGRSFAGLIDLNGPLAVRSAFSAEDGDRSSMAGRFDSLLGVEAKPAALGEAITLVRASASVLSATEAASTRLDVLVMEQVAAVRSGVAFTEQQFEDDLVNVASGLADRLVSGEEAGERLTLPKLRRWERPSRSHSSWARRLSRLLVGVRRVFGDADWDIEWADDGEVCWLVQIRRVTAAPQRNEAFTVANHKEILPELPSTLMTSVIERGAPELMAFWADADATLPIHRPFVETFLGRPYLNLSMLTDLMRALGLPTRLVTDSYGGEPDVDVGLKPLRLIAKAPTLLRLGWSQVVAVRSADAAGHRVEQAVPAGPGFGPALDCFVDQYVGLVAEMSSLASSLAPPTAILKSLGALDSHLRRHRTAATMMLERLEPVRDALSEGAAEGDFSFDAAWETWLGHHGHRGVFESDIARPRFRDDPTPILAAAHAAGRARNASDKNGLRRALTVPIWFAVKRAMTAREDLRDSSMRGFAESRDRFVELTARAVADGQLPDLDAVWELTADELRTIDGGATFERAEIEHRRTIRKSLLLRRLPDTVRRFDDLDAPVAASTATLFRGLSLTRGTIRGRALRASEPPSVLPPGFDPASTILVARSVDAGWVPIFGQVAGVAVEIGGDLSHGSIVLRELGLPAATNLGEIGSSITTGDLVELRAGAGVLERLDSDA